MSHRALDFTRSSHSDVHRTQQEKPGAEELPALSSAVDRLAARLEILRRMDQASRSVEPMFDRLARTAARLLAVPVSLVSFVEEDRQVFRGAQGLPEPWASRRQTPISHSFCRHVAESGRPLVVNDARGNPLVCRNPAITDLGVVAYLGVPITAPKGQALGSFCAIDHAPRGWTEDDMRAMRDLAAVVSEAIALRLDNADLRLAADRRPPRR